MGDAQLHPDQRGGRALRPYPRLVRVIADHAVAPGEAGRPAEDGHLDAERRERQADSQGLQQRMRPRARHEHHRGGVDAPAGGLHPGDSAALGHDARRLAVRADLDAEAPGRLGEGERGGVRVGVARVGLVRGAPEVVHAALGQDLAHLVGGDHAGLDPDRLLGGDITLQPVAMAAGHQLQVAEPLEAAVASDPMLPIVEVLEALVSEAGLVGVGVVHAHQRARLAAGPSAQLTTLHQDHARDATLGQVKCGAAPVDPASDDDDVRSLIGHNARILACLTGRGEGPIRRTTRTLRSHDPEPGVPRKAASSGQRPIPHFSVRRNAA